MNEELTEIVRVMGMPQGRDISLHDDAFLAKSIEKRLAATGIKTTAAYRGYLSENSTEAEIFSCALNITYSEFFRNPLTFALLEQIILPRLVAETEKAGRAELRVWPAAYAAEHLRGFRLGRLQQPAFLLPGGHSATHPVLIRCGTPCPQPDI